MATSRRYLLLALLSLFVIVSLVLVRLAEFDFEIVNVLPLRTTDQIESLGVNNFNWKTTDIDNMKPQDIISYFYWTNRSSCKLSHDFGGQMFHNPSGLDGQKAVCLDPDVRPTANRCIVYSFGISYEWSFDEAMEDYGCKVYAFDPSMNEGVYDYSKSIHFYNFGLGDRDYITADDRNWTMKTLSSIYQMLVPLHGNAVIDYLKMDIEFAEWDVIPQIISSGMLAKVRQLGVEFHLREEGDLEKYKSLVRVIKGIEDAGMIRFDSKYNPWFPGQIKSLGGYNGSLGFEIAFYQNLSHM